MPVPEVELSAPLAQAAKLSTVTPWAKERCEDGNVEEGKEEDRRLSSRPPLFLRVWRRSGDQRINERRDVCSRDRGLSGKKQRVRWAAGRCFKPASHATFSTEQKVAGRGWPKLASKHTHSFHQSHHPGRSSFPLARSIDGVARRHTKREGTWGEEAFLVFVVWQEDVAATHIAGLYLCPVGQRYFGLAQVRNMPAPVSGPRRGFGEMPTRLLRPVHPLACVDIDASRACARRE